MDKIIEQIFNTASFPPPRSPRDNVAADAFQLLFLVRFVLYHCRGPTFNIASGGQGDENENASFPKSTSQLDSLFLFDFIVHLLSRLYGRQDLHVAPVRRW